MPPKKKPAPSRRSGGGVPSSATSLNSTTITTSSYSTKLILPVTVCILSILYIYWGSFFSLFNTTKVHSFEENTKKSWNIPCVTEDYVPKIEGCTPKQCKRILTNNFTSLSEVDNLLRVAKTAMSFGGGSGGPTIFDITTGALSKDDAFVDLYKVLRREKSVPFYKSDFQLVVNIIQKIKSFLTKEFNLKGKANSEKKSEEDMRDGDQSEKGEVAPLLYLTKPLFFSRMYGIETNPPKTFHDEYWHVHVDKEAYGTFIYTCLLYLSDFGTDFQGGEFVFDDTSHQTIYPAKGTLSCFTSGNENPHHVEKVVSGIRWALTIAFTCQSTNKAPDFILLNKDLLIRE